MSTNENNWVVNFLNIPSKEQIEFLYRYSLQKSLREEIEKKVLAR